MRKQTITIQPLGRRVKAEMHGAFAIHRQVVGRGKRFSRRWSITHIDTGYAFVQGFKSRRAARKCLGELASLARYWKLSDWVIL